ncbi:putative bifunctional diguanylate cyclase/phosphodiesterase [Kineococcus gynurae]|uniref:putative bifunctional diguanylate cyclase/phosphodiesterase n=1 Tax=Kineococcus gynurae TaxID=452979 RepID=UPI0036D3D680
MATPRMMALTTGWLYLAGGLTALVVGVSDLLVAADGVPLSFLHLLAIGLTAMGTGAIVLVWGGRWPRAFFHVLVGGGSVLITLATLAAGSASGTMVAAAIFTFVAIDAAFYFAPPAALAHLLLLLTGLVVALSTRGVPALDILGLFLVCLAVCAVTAVLVDRASSADRDTLTGLPNRRRFEEAFATATRGRNRHELTLAVLDLDDLAAVNDGRGPGEGDELLRAVARTLHRTVTDAVPGAVVARYGGDEFVLLLPGTCGDVATRLVDGLRAEVGIAFSCGLAQRAHGESRSALLRRALAALTAAKTGGGGRTERADDATALLAADLTSALAEDPDQFHVVHQPIVDLTTGDLLAVEALCRWTHPTRGPVSPAEFIPAAENAGLIAELGALVLERACADAVRLRAVQPDLVVAVNVSGRQLVRPGFYAEVLDVLHRTGLPASGLCIEVTESVVDGSTPTALRTLEMLHADRVQVAIDDFGTGYSAFSRLDALPAHHLKLDAAFTAGITTSGRRAGILRGLLDMCAALGLSVVAEGVETCEQATKLRELGCPSAQGFLFARPQPVSEIHRRLLEARPAPAVQSAAVGR